MLRKIFVSMLITSMFMGSFWVEVSAQSLDAETILKNTDEVEGYVSCYSEMQQTITTSSGQKRTLVMRGWAVNNGEKQLSEYLSPADIKGQKILMTEDGPEILTPTKGGPQRGHRF